jgi:hypothetical protein
MEEDVMEETCKRLWIAVLKQAIEDARGNYHRNREKALSWFNSENQGTGSFLWICSILGFNPNLTRMNLTTSRVSDVVIETMKIRSEGRGTF